MSTRRILTPRRNSFPRFQPSWTSYQEARIACPGNRCVRKENDSGSKRRQIKQAPFPTSLISYDAVTLKGLSYLYGSSKSRVTGRVKIDSFFLFCFVLQIMKKNKSSPRIKNKLEMSMRHERNLDKILIRLFGW